WRFGELFFGSLDRNWGPPALEGLIVSPSPYSYDHLALSLGTRRIQLQGIVTELDDLPDTSGALNHRFFIAHRLLWRPSRRCAMKNRWFNAPEVSGRSSSSVTIPWSWMRRVPSDSAR